MDFVHGGPSGLQLSSLKLVMQELASLPDYMDSEKCADAIRRLHDTCKKIVEMLEGWNGDQISGTDMETWLDSLEEYCYDAEDIIDGIRLGLSDKWFLQVDNLHRDFERVGREIERVWMTQEPTHLKPQQLRNNQSPIHEILSLDRTHLVGRDDDLQFIIREMCDGLFCGVSIIGMDGLGKTSLARCIIGDTQIHYQFSQRLYASVSAHFQIEDIVHKLLASSSVTKCKATGSEPRGLRDIISGRGSRSTTGSEPRGLRDITMGHRSRSTLIILDDLWSVNREDWDKFRSSYLDPSESSGTKVLITTRNPEVAAVTDTTAHYLSRITDEECRDLIMVKSGLIDAESDKWASDVRVIARKCEGMPIVAAMFGSELSKKRSLDQRKESIAKFTQINLWELPEFKEVFPSLKLNEPTLPPHLKTLFEYFSLFSPNAMFFKEDLIKLWEAQGFVCPQHQAGSQPTGSQCFDDLVSRSILLKQKSSNEMQPWYELNVFHHQFASLLASKAFLSIDGGTLSFLTSCKNVRHLALTGENIDVSLLKQMKEYKRLRTFIVRPQHAFERCTISLTPFPEFKSLRVLNLSHTNITRLPRSLSQLYHLRYLDLSESDIESLPDPIHSLCELQTLKLRNCYSLERLPGDLNQLINLMCLDVDMKRLSCLPSDLGKLVNLEILNSFYVGRREGSTIAELKNMNRLREIHISGLENICSTTDAQEIMLSEKHTLQRLVLEWDLANLAVLDARDVLEGLQPHNDLKELIVRNYNKRFPPWLVSRNRTLVSIHLETCHGCKALPALGQLPLLKKLVLYSIRYVDSVDRHFFGDGEVGFPSLESLEFLHMKNLFEWIYLEAKHMPYLRSLKFIHCPRLTYLTSLLKLSSRGLLSIEINTCPELQLISAIRKDVKEIIIDGVLDQPKGSHATKTSVTSTSQPLDKYKVQHSEITPAEPSKQDDGGHMLQEPGDEKVMGAEPKSSPWFWCLGRPWASFEKTGASVEKREDIQEDDQLLPSSKEKDKDVSMTPHEAKVSDPVIMEETEEYFSILSLLPKNYEFEEDTLIQLWMAAGHIKDETKGKQHFNHLLNQKFLLRSGTNFFTNKGRYHINIEPCQKIKHLSEGRNDTLKWENECNMDKYSAGIQHVSLVFKGIDETIFQKLQQFSELRTLLFLANYGPLVKEIPAHFFKSFEKLRALDLSGTHIKKLPSSVGHMQYLRYLDLSRTLIEWLPGTICSLKELQTLKLQECWELCELPEQLSNLTELRDLDVDVLSQLTTMPKGMKALQNLRTLSAFLVGTEDGYKVNELENLNNLTGDFCIAKLENVGSEDEARNAALDQKRNIKRLELRWTAPEYSWMDNKSDPSVVLERLEPCSVLEELQILCYEGSTFPSWVSNPKFEKLVHVSFYKCEKMSELPPLEQLPSLKYLILVQMNSVERFEVQGRSNMVAFPSLEKFKMNGMESLRTWRLLKTNGDDFKRLTDIMMNDCPSLQKFDGLLSLSSIKCLEISKCPKLASVSNSNLPQTLDTLIVEDCHVIRKDSINSENEDEGGGEDESHDAEAFSFG